MRYLLTLCLLLNGVAGQAQQPITIQAEIYSTFLRDKFAQDIELLSGKSNYEISNGRMLRRRVARFNRYVPVVLVMPASRNGGHILGKFSLAEAIKYYQLTPENIAQAPAGISSQYLPIPVGTRIKAYGWEREEFIHNNPTLYALGLKFDSLQQTTQKLPGPITMPNCHVLVPGGQVLSEGADTLKPRNTMDYIHLDKMSLGVVELSEIAVSADNRYAVFYMNKRPANSCFADDGFVFLENTAEGWKTRLITKMRWL